MLPLGDAEPFALLSTFLVRRLVEGATRLRLWSAACGSGEEAWSLAIAVEDLPGLGGADVRILATDRCAEALDRARDGAYEPARIDPGIRERWFEPLPDGRVAVRSRLRERMLFARLDLSRPPFPIQGPLDAIVCRSAIGALEPDRRRALALEFQRLLGPGGLLVVAPGETIAGPDGFRLARIAPSIYALADEPLSRSRP